MDPISKEVFSHDYVKYVYQDPNPRIVNHGLPPAKPFEIKSPEKSKKTKKDLKKGNRQDGEKPPFLP